MLTAAEAGGLVHLATVNTALAGWVLLGEALTAVQTAGMALALGCVVLAQRVGAGPGPTGATRGCRTGAQA